MLHDCGVKLTKHEFKILTTMFKQGDIGLINYIRMSKELGLHSNKLGLIQPSLFHPTMDRSQGIQNQGSHSQGGS